MAEQTAKYKIRPIRDHIVVKRNEADAKTPGGIVLPDAAKDKPTRGVVFAVGTGIWHDGRPQPLEINRGDEVLFNRYGGTEIEIDGEEFTILREQDILVVLTKVES